MKVKDVIIEYHAMVPFPWTPRKLKKAGFEPTPLLLELGKKLGQCEDSNTPAAKDLLDTLEELDVLS